MNRRKTLYRVLALISIGFISYALMKNFLIDPGAHGFLSYKTGLKRELKLPLWLNVMYIHVAFACLAMASGLINFSGRVLEKHRRFHRINGYLYIVSVLIVVITSGYMAPYATGGKISSMGFNLLNIIWPAITLTALIYIRKKQMIKHRNWMIRSYAFCFTNMLIHLIASLFHRGFGFQYPDSYTIGVYGSIALLLIIPEAVIRMIGQPPTHKQSNHPIAKG
ncbi:DUF2306 domain-containing protein [Paenibacillus paeoniae]|uniref:DUF2306 domain-containing protein n=1 Tax=Paenibacillus paeoniae TaxID=2292705 RepID=A0A371PI79_9BACL|nr:DUF2306 domain-containing protein [Paenibacillus paeoniae]REK75605.1 DUF2306 domain-containing protein [Paenibacillus paeoniae]